MAILLGALAAGMLGGCICLAILWLVEHTRTKRLLTSLDSEREQAKAVQQELKSELQTLHRQLQRLKRWESVANADEQAKEIREQAARVLRQAEADARILIANAEQQFETALARAQAQAADDTATARASAKAARDEARLTLDAAAQQARSIVAEATVRAEQIAGKAYDAVQNAELYERTARAMRNIVEGYGDQYLHPAASLLDDLAAEFGHKDAGRQLKLAREQTTAMVKAGKAARCEYVESSRREGAERFVLDAFNGKVDSILTRIRHDNFGKLEQEIHDAFTIVNFGGKAFREARITDEYRDARLTELRWAVITQELRRQELEEQRLIREQIREEEKARREHERAIRESAKEEEVLRKAMAKAQAQIEQATSAQRAQYESQLAELSVRLREAEERNQRAISMAQQTRRGHVYIISNVGSFGDGVFKIGVTRRLEPLDRIKELGDASVPFDFDVHAIILSDDAPALETRLHKHFILNQINKVNHRKEFFRAAVADIRREIEQMGIEAKWTMLSEAREFRESLAIERAIEADPAARAAWLNRQFTLDPVAYAELSADEDE